jgi:hypothetical protein
MPINWHRPIELATTGEVLHFVGWSANGRQAIVEAKSSNTIYRADVTTGSISLGTCVRNVKEPWEKAFDDWQGQPAEQDYSVRQTFKEAFEAGRLWEKKK